MKPIPTVSALLPCCNERVCEMAAAARYAPFLEEKPTLDLEKVLDEVVRRIVPAVQPRRIILFGSAARGRLGPHSDLDPLVVMPDGTHRRKTAMSLHRLLAGLGVPKDVVVVTQTDVERFGHEPSLVICPALREGREIYRAAS